MTFNPIQRRLSKFLVPCTRYLSSIPGELKVAAELQKSLSIGRSSNPKPQYQTYNTYKSHNTVKKLFICTQTGSINYISDSYAGSAANKFITKDTNIAARFTPGYSVLFDKGFTVQDLFLQYKVTARIPPFVRSKRQLNPLEVAVGKRIARARIHIERIIGRLKELRLLDHTLPLKLVNLPDEIWINVCA